MNLPILQVTDPSYSANPFGEYLAEILAAEGFLAVERALLAEVDSALLARHPIAVLGETRPDEERRGILRRYVAGGGRLVAMRPDPQLADLFGLAHAGARREAPLQYLAVSPESEIARGIERGPLQYHGEADEYLVRSASPVAWLYDSPDSPSAHPAVALNRYGHGQTVAFAFDLARSVALTRQGNPAWACGPNGCEDGDGFPGIRPVDSFLRTTGERWVDPSRIAVPQADEQQRLLANALMALGDGVMPLPRLWYLPADRRSVLVMTGDGDFSGFEAFDPIVRTVEEDGGHFSAYLHLLDGDPTAAQVEDWIARGHEVGLHMDYGEGRVRPNLEGFRSAYEWGGERFRALYGRAPGPSVRHHWLTWYGWTEAAEAAHGQGIRLDFNFYHGRQWRLPDGGWANGYFTGSALPQRFVRADGNLLDVYQQLTVWADETQLYAQQLGLDRATRLVSEMLDSAEARYPAVFVANFHPGGWKSRGTEAWARNMMREAAERGTPIWSGEDLHRFIAARAGAHLADLTWDGARLALTLESPAAPLPLSLMLPARFDGRPLASVSSNGAPVPFRPHPLAGRDYALVPVAGSPRRLSAIYAPDG